MTISVDDIMNAPGQTPERTRHTTAAVILAGGRGVRMGGCDKALLPLGEGCVLDVLLARLGPQVDAIALSANGDARRFSEWKLPVLPDEFPDDGPLGGVMQALLWGAQWGYETIVTVPGDTPFIPATLVADLLPGPAMACTDGNAHPLVATWPVACLPDLQAWLSVARASRDHRALRVRAFSDHVGMRSMSFHVDLIDPFFNINTPQELVVASSHHATNMAGKTV